MAQPMAWYRPSLKSSAMCCHQGDSKLTHPCCNPQHSCQLGGPPQPLGVPLMQAHELAHAMCLYHPFHVQLVHGGVPLDQDIAALRGSCPELLVATPGRLMELLSQGRRVRLDHLLGHVQLLALDGVEELLSAVALSSSARRLGLPMPTTSTHMGPAACQLLMLAAAPALHPEMQQQVHSLAALAAPHLHNASLAACTGSVSESSGALIQLLVVPAPQLLLQLYALLRLHMGQRAGSRSLVLCPTAELARVWARALRGLGLPTLELHSRKSQAYREQAVHVFKHGAHGSGLGGLGEGEGEGLAGGWAPGGQAQAAAGQGGQGGPMQAGGLGQAQVPRGLVMLSSGGVTTGLDLPDLTLLVQVLKLQPGNVKALFRRGTARHALGQTEGAKVDLTAAAEKSPDDKAIRTELQALRQTLRAEREAEATLFKGQFKFADPKPSTVGTQEEQQVHNSQDTAQPGSGSSHPTLPLVAQPASLLSKALVGLWGLCSWLATMFGMLLGLKVPVKDR
ncbi:hypothetical protein V8C86DRAFT_3024307 [Haematococcus lacustris]